VGTVSTYLQAQAISTNFVPMALVFPLSEGTFTVGHDKEFIPFDESADVLRQRPTGSLLVEVQPFLVVTDKDLIVIDTGLGFKNSAGVLQIHHNIQALGYDMAAVTKVLLSHLHKDHAGCLTYTTNEGAVQPTFPNATYHIYRNEADFALKTGKPSYYPADIEPILSSGQVHWLDGPAGAIDGYITYTHSGGHSPQHIVFLIDDGTQKIFYGGDEVPQLKQLKVKYVAKYDYDGKRAMQLREQYAAAGREQQWLFLFYHDVKMPMAALS
jgi:glyoxylase-like metal-dependent hydrolase (beta-lactamase superfamily II)